jgi:hypothetical protein
MTAKKNESQEEYDNDKLIEIFKLVLESEEKFPVWDWQIDGVPIWPIISIRFLAVAGHHFHTGRIKLPFGPFVQKPGYKGPKQPSLFSKGGLRKIRDKFFRVRSEVTQATKSDPLQGLPEDFPRDLQVLFIGNTTASYMFGDISIQQIVDPYRIEEEKLGCRTANFVVGAQAEHPAVKQAWAKDVYPFAGIQSSTANRSHGRDLQLRQDLKGYAAWEEHMCKVTGLASLGEDIWYNNEVKTTLEYIRFFRVLFATCPNLKRAYQVCFYGPIGYALNFVCREKGIDAIDIQHGVQGRDHRPYYFPKAQSGRVSLLPTHYYNWTQEDADLINSWGQAVGVKGENKGLTWKLFLQAVNDSATAKLSFVKNYKKIADQIALYREQRDGVLANGAQMQILYTSFMNEDLPWLLDFLQFCKENNLFLWWRLHPAELQKPGVLEKAQEIAKGFPCDVETSSRIPLPLILEKADLHMTSFSSTTIEANAYGVPTLTYSKQGVMFYQDNCQASGFIYADGFESVKAEVKKMLEEKKPKGQNGTQVEL